MARLLAPWRTKDPSETDGRRRLSGKVEAAVPLHPREKDNREIITGLVKIIMLVSCVRLFAVRRESKERYCGGILCN